MDFRPERHIGDILKERNIEIVGADPITRHGFTQVPNFLLTNKDLRAPRKIALARAPRIRLVDRRSNGWMKRAGEPWVRGAFSIWSGGSMR